MVSHEPQQHLVTGGLRGIGDRGDQRGHSGQANVESFASKSASPDRAERLPVTGRPRPLIPDKNLVQPARRVVQTRHGRGAYGSGLAPAVDACEGLSSLPSRMRSSSPAALTAFCACCFAPSGIEPIAAIR